LGCVANLYKLGSVTNIKLEQIHKDFPYFAALHQFLSTRPNIVPPVITTGTGPRGRQVVHNQPVEPLVAAQGFDESTIDPYLLNRSATPPPGSFSQTGGSEDLDVSPSRLISTNSRIRAQQTPQTGNGQGAAPKSVKGPKPSTFGTDLTNAMEKARSNLKHVPKKRSLEDVIMESSRYVLILASDMLLNFLAARMSGSHESVQMRRPSTAVKTLLFRRSSSSWRCSSLAFTLSRKPDRR
jgi:hypothetical protein